MALSIFEILEYYGYTATENKMGKNLANSSIIVKNDKEE